MNDQQQPFSSVALSNEVKTPPWLKLITENFAVLSSSTLVLAVLCATVFLYGYLAVFDWHLIWIVEYSDILKFGLVAVAIISGSVLIIQQLFNYVMIVMEKQGKARWVFIAVLGIMLIAPYAYGIYSESRMPSPRYLLYTSIGLSTALFAMLVFAVWQSVKKPSRWNFFEIGGAVFFLTIALGSFGSTMGFYVKSEKGYEHDISLKDRDLTDVRLVMFTSHHTIIYDGTAALVIQTSDVVRVVGREKASTKSK
jgi:hypothetical protein